MIRSKEEYKITKERIANFKRIIILQRTILNDAKFTEEEIRKATEPMISFLDKLIDEVTFYEQKKPPDFEVI